MSNDNKKAIIFVTQGHVNKGETHLSEAGKDQSTSIAKKIRDYLESKDMLLGKEYGNRGYNIAIHSPLEDGSALDTARILNDVLKTDQITMGHYLNKGKWLASQLYTYAIKAPEKTECLIFSTYSENVHSMGFHCDLNGVRNLSDSNVVIFEHEGNWSDIGMHSDKFKGLSPVNTLRP